MTSTNRLADTWDSREYPVLRAAAAILSASGASITPSELATAEGLDLDEAEIEIAVSALEPTYLTIAHGPMRGGYRDLYITGLTDEGRRATGLWPSPETAADRLLSALEALSDRAPDEPTRSRARGALDQLGGFSRDTLAAIAATVITGQIPGSSS